VIKQKYITNSDGFLTGVLNLTMDKAPTIPRERAIFVEMTDVIIYPVMGSNPKTRY